MNLILLLIKGIPIPLGFDGMTTAQECLVIILLLQEAYILTSANMIGCINYIRIIGIIYCAVEKWAL